MHMVCGLVVRSLRRSTTQNVFEWSTIQWMVRGRWFGLLRNLRAEASLAYLGVIVRRGMIYALRQYLGPLLFINIARVNCVTHRPWNSHVRTWIWIYIYIALLMDAHIVWHGMASFFLGFRNGGTRSPVSIATIVYIYHRGQSRLKWDKQPWPKRFMAPRKSVNYSFNVGQERDYLYSFFLCAKP